MIQIRPKVFETNSSSVHSLIMCTGDEYERLKEEELLIVIDPWGSSSEYADQTFVTPDQARDIAAKDKYYEGPDPYELSIGEFLENYHGIKTLEDYCDTEWFEGFEESYTTPGGEKVVAFGYFGHD